MHLYIYAKSETDCDLDIVRQNYLGEKLFDNIKNLTYKDLIKLLPGLIKGIEAKVIGDESFDSVWGKFPHTHKAINNSKEDF
jgi:hypothetical protein